MRQVVLAFLGSVFPAILFNIDRKKLIWAGISGALGWAVYMITNNCGGGIILGTFMGSMVVGLYSEIMARIIKAPGMQFSIPGIFPLVPGIMAYNTVIYIVEGNYNRAFENGTQTIIVAGAIAFGIMIASTTYRFFSKIYKDIHSIKNNKKKRIDSSSCD